MVQQWAEQSRVAAAGGKEDGVLDEGFSAGGNGLHEECETPPGD